MITINSIKGKNKQAVIKTVTKTMNDSGWTSFIKGKKVFIKINLVSSQVIPGLCTSPWVLEGVLKELSKKNFKITVGDCDVATTNQVELAAKNWGILDVCKKYNAKFINLSKAKTIKVINLNNDIKFLKEINLPSILFQADSIITIPVLKTHNLSLMTCALKNQWGFLPKYRHNYHNDLDQVVAEINKTIPVSFCVVDATVCSEGNSPRCGTPKIVNKIIAGNNLASIDIIASRIIGLDYHEIPYIEKSLKLGIDGIMSEIFGSYKNEHFRPPAFSFIILIEMFLRKIPVINYLIFKTFLFKIFGWLITRYNDTIWYNFEGKRAIKKFLKSNSFYVKEFKKIIYQQVLIPVLIPETFF